MFIFSGSSRYDDGALSVSGSRHEQRRGFPHLWDGRDPETSLRLGSQEILKLLIRGETKQAKKKTEKKTNKKNVNKNEKTKSKVDDERLNQG